jgi:parallel beta-helix repeat protein
MYYSKLILSSSKFVLALLIGAALFLSGCGNEESDDITGGNGTTIEHSSTITSDETWAKGDIHIIKGYVYVNDAILTIEAGTTVQFASDAALIIQTAAGLIADGTTGQITFTGQTKQNGFWRYIEFQDAAANLNCKMINCLVEYGGGYGDNASMLYIYNNPTISSCTFRYSSSNGVEIDDDARPVFNNNTITLNTKSPVIADFESAASIGYGDYSGNGQEYIDLSSGTLTYDAALKKQNVPYSFSGYNYINNATLTIEAGTNILMNTDAAVIVGENGGFVAQGTSSDSIVISSRVAQKGYWRYIEFQDDAVSAECKLDYCAVEFGGGYGTTASMLYIYNNATVTNSAFRSSSSNGVYIDDDARPTFSNNTITLNDLSPINGDFESAASIGYGLWKLQR